MSAHKKIDRICIIITAITLVIAFVFCNSQTLGIKTTAHAIGYEDRLFDRSKVHTIDIVMNDWAAPRPFLFKRQMNLSQVYGWKKTNAR